MNFFYLLLAKKLGGGGGGITPSGTIEISENGQYDVTQYAEANVNVQGGGGGGFTETLLWENPNPNQAFGSTTVLYTGDITEFDYIKYVWKTASNIATTFESMFKASSLNAGMYGAFFSISGNASYVRLTYFVSGELRINGNTSRLNGTGSDASTSIPLYVYGVKLS